MYFADWVALVRVYQNNRLPRPQGEATVEHGDNGRRSDDPGHHVIGSVSGRSVAVPIVTVVPRKHGVERIHQIVVAPCPRLDNRDTRRRMGNEDVEKAVALACNESIGLGCEIEDASPVSRLDRKDLSVHDRSSDVLALEDGTHRSIGEDRTDGPSENRSDGEHGDLPECVGFGGNGERVRDDEFVDGGVCDSLDRRR